MTEPNPVVDSSQHAASLAVPGGPAPAPTYAFWLPGVLTVVSLNLWFWLGFPWQHHNESLVWAVELDRVPFWSTLISNPITPVQTYRPLGVGLAWLAFHATHQGIWLQQVLNFVITAFAWLLALRAVPNRTAFSWLSFLCNAGYFSGYIYLFHLHGVFYGPLFVYLAYLLNLDRRGELVSWRMSLMQLAIAVAAALFHTFALLFYAAFLGGLWLQNRLASRPSSLWATLVCVAISGILVKLLASGAPGLGDDSAVLGSLATYRALELNPILSVLSALLAALTVSSLALSLRTRAVLVAFTCLFAVGLAWMQIPVISLWIGICLLKSLCLKRTVTAALIGATALLSAATGTGSPTYALFTLMPCIVATVEGVEFSSVVTLRLRQFGIAALLATVLLFVTLKMGIYIPTVTNQVRALQAEKEKTQQLMDAFAWLESHTEVRGHLELCEPGDFPVRSGNAIVRTYRAPTHAWPFEQYVNARFGPRLREQEPALLLCFGGQTVPDSHILHEIPGRWAGPVTLLRR